MGFFLPMRYNALVLKKHIGIMLSKTPSWKKLQQKASDKSITDLRKLFSDSNRVDRFSFKFGKLHLDLSKNWLDESVHSLLCKLAEEMQLSQKIDDLFAQKIVNVTENQAASHILVRDPSRLKDNHQALFTFAEKIKQHQLLTAFGQPVKHIVNVGIGGSYLGPRLVTEAMTDLQSNADMTIDFIASVDDSLINQLFLSIDPENTLFCISSKSFGTVETLNNATAILQRLKNIPGYNTSQNHSSMMAITANQDRAVGLGIPESHILNFDHTIGGRFSLWSSIGFPIVMAAGEQTFIELLKGAASMDKHFQQTKFDNNLPVLMALTSIWYRNFMGLSAYTALPYDARLRCFPAWLQQLMMESTGKMHDASGEQLHYPTSPWVFGDHGQLSQHAFFQAFHQGNDILPIDFIGVLNPLSESQQFLLVNMIAQGAALMNGKTADNPLSHCLGNRPSSTLLLEDLSATAMGQLLALYEHMVYTQSVLWGVNCFDQPGVELGKDIARNIEQHIRHNTLNQLQLDPSTEALIQHVMKDE
ncbi:glucose-6-phosphate isomerase [Marinicella sp. W31]|uniref:glucose-6-phosphate isomerase n=1 Tax=Marinicella sp. W31 TaxID=3023713 RepID=UPI0037565640